MNFMDRYIIPVATKVGNQRHLVAIRDAFVAMMTILIVGALALLFVRLADIIPPYAKMMQAIFGEDWAAIGLDIWWGTYAFMTIFVVFAVSYKLAKSYGDEGIEAMIVGGASFFLLVPQVADVVLDEVSGKAWGFISWGYFNATSMFTGIIISIIATEIFIRLSKIKKFEITMPAGVPPAVASAFQKLIPGMLTVFIVGIFGVFFRTVTNGQVFNDWLNAVLVAPLSEAADSLPFVLLIVFLTHLFWMVGLHGPNILGGITTPLVEKLGAENMDLFAQGIPFSSGEYSVFAGSFLDAFVYLGGSGATLGLIIALIIAGKRRKQMVAIGGAPGVFQINEPMLFGMPIVLNPIWFVPFVFTPAVLSITSYLSVSAGLVPPVVAKIPWVTPPIIGGFLATGGAWQGAVLAAINLVISIAIYLPFVILSERIDARKEAEAQNDLSNSQSTTSAV